MIETERLVLKPYSDNDRESMAELLTNEEIKKTFMIPDFKCDDEITKMFNKLKEFSLSPQHYERGIYKDDRLIGFVNDVEINNKSIELGYVIHPAYQHKGYCSEAFKAAIDDLFKKGFTEIIAGAFVENEASFNVMKKIGMKLMDKEDDIKYHGSMHHCLYYSIKKRNISYRKAVKSDAKLLVDIYNKSFYDDYVRYGECPAYGRSVERMEMSIANFPKEIILCDDVPVGVLSVENKGNGEYYLGCLCVIPEYQGKGIGTIVVRHLLSSLSDLRKITLITPSDKKENVDFYTKKCGFKITGSELDGNVHVTRFVIENKRR